MQSPTNAGESEFTVIFNGARSFDAVFVMPITAALEAE